MMGRLRVLMSSPPVRTIAGATCALLVLYGTSLTHDPDAQVGMPKGYLSRAVAAGSAEQVDLAVGHHADLNQAGTDGRPPVLIAAQQQDWPIVRRLIEAGARTDVADASGLTPLMVAAMQ